MKRIFTTLIFFLCLPSLYAASYVLKVAPQIEGILHINNTKPIKISSTNASREKHFSTSLYSEGILFSRAKTADGMIENTCHITFLKNATWMPQSFEGDRCSFLQNNSNNQLIIKKPLLQHPKVQSSHFAPLNPDRVYLVDYQASKGGNLFFRGNNPFTKGFHQQVDFKGLFSAMQKKFHQQAPNATFPKSFELIDISILSRNPYGEDIIVRKEGQNFGATNPIADVISPAFNQTAFFVTTTDKQITGRFLSWPVEKTYSKITSTNQNLSTVIQALKSTGNETKPIQDLIEHIHHWMNTKHKVPVIVYVHCLNGQDRTSEVVVTYLMRQYKMPLSKAYIEGTTLLDQHNQKVRFLPISKDYHPAMRWYCAYLKNKGYRLEGGCLVKLNGTKISAHYPWEQ
ncbi:MAG: dual specificity protein phosphatase family protein [Gammaproteobacteria bacterium]|nr:dual specificity protein phosphatase family protein [Gammaproteobacteria bacterium]